LTDATNTGHGGSIQDAYPGDAPIGAVREPTGVRWLTMLVWFMRLAAVFWLMRGLLHWAYIIGLGGADFPDLRLSRQGIIMGLAVLDLVAAVGMWLTSSWGAAVWLVVLFIETMIVFLVPELGVPVADAFVAVGSALMYLFFVWKAAGEQRAA